MTGLLTFLTKLKITLTMKKTNKGQPLLGQISQWAELQELNQPPTSNQFLSPDFLDNCREGGAYPHTIVVGSMEPLYIVYLVVGQTLALVNFNTGEILCSASGISLWDYLMEPDSSVQVLYLDKENIQSELQDILSGITWGGTDHMISILDSLTERANDYSEMLQLTGNSNALLVDLLDFIAILIEEAHISALREFASAAVLAPENLTLAILGDPQSSEVIPIQREILLTWQLAILVNRAFPLKEPNSPVTESPETMFNHLIDRHVNIPNTEWEYGIYYSILQEIKRVSKDTKYELSWLPEHPED